ncbi:MAG: hypothetical protein HY867_08660 [Chloroflexi bacterium]|nr:hypothetical protein [Chloroflexota bacterium]
MVTDQEFQQLHEQVIKLEEKVVRLQSITAGLDWESKMAEYDQVWGIPAAVNFYQEHVDRHASMSEAMGHVMEIKKKIGK